MFKKFYEKICNKIDEKQIKSDEKFADLQSEFADLKRTTDKNVGSAVARLDAIVEEYKRDRNKNTNTYVLTIEREYQIISALFDIIKRDYKEGIILIALDGERPRIIKDGKELIDKHTAGFSVAWHKDWTGLQMPEINIEY